MEQDLRVLDEVVEELLAAANAPSPHTLASYQRRWRMWESFAAHHGVSSLPADPEHVAAFVIARRAAGVGEPTVAANLSSVAWFHRALGGDPSSTTALARRVLIAVRPDGGYPTQRSVAPILSVGALNKMVRVPAIAGTGHFAAKVLRLMTGVAPRQLAGLNVNDVAFGRHDAWVKLTVPAVGRVGNWPALRSATFQFDRGLTPMDCPVEALRTLTEMANDSGELFPRGFPSRATIKGFEPAAAPDGVHLRLLVRNRSLVRIGYSGALRVQEIVRLRAEDVEPTSSGYRLRLVGAKTSRGLRSQFVTLRPTPGFLDPVAAIDEWIAVRGDHDGPLFCSVHHGRFGQRPGGPLSSGEIGEIVGGLANSAGLGSTVSGYSLRRSWATHAYLRDPQGLRAISSHLRHASVDMTTRYIDNLGLQSVGDDSYLSEELVRVSGPDTRRVRKDLGFDNASLESLVERVRSAAGSGRAISDRTRQAQDREWSRWARWAQQHQFSPMPASPESLALFAAARASSGIRASTLRAQLRRIQLRHQDAGHTSSELLELASGIVDGLARHDPGPNSKGPVLSLAELLRMAATAERFRHEYKSRAALRDLMMLAVGYCGALKPRDLSLARLELLEECAHGLILHLAEPSTTTHQATRRSLLLQRDDLLDPVAAVNNWKDATGLQSGPLLVHTTGQLDRPIDQEFIATRLQLLASLADVETRPTGLSLRRSWAAHAYASGVDSITLSRHLGHRNLSTTLNYVQALAPWRDNAATSLLNSDQNNNS